MVLPTSSLLTLFSDGECSRNTSSSALRWQDEQGDAAPEHPRG